MVQGFFRIVLLGLGLTAGAVWAAPNTPYYQRETEEEKVFWQDEAVVFPSVPQASNLIPLYLSASAQNRFWVDKASVQVGNGMVRYTLVVLSAGGVRGASYEGIRCDTRELRRYAILKNDAEWVRSRNESWMRITESPGHRQYAVLYLENFCPNGAIVMDSAEAVRNLVRGGRSSLDSPTQNY